MCSWKCEKKTVTWPVPFQLPCPTVWLMKLVYGRFGDGKPILGVPSGMHSGFLEGKLTQ